MNKTIITFTPTGMLPKKAETPKVPISPCEIVSDVKIAYDLGITTVHLHARNTENESPAWEKEYFREIILGIRDFAPDLVISVTTSGRTYNEFDKRSNVLELTGDAKPDMASLTLSSLNFNQQASINEPSMIQALAGKMKGLGIKPELEVFDIGMINNAKYLIRKNFLQPPFFFNLIMGNIACAQADLLHVGVMLNDLPENSVPVLGGIGNFQLSINALAISMGYGVRVGLEDNIWFDEQRTKLASNEDYIKRIHTISKAIGREICSPIEFRKLLNLKPGYGSYGVNEDEISPHIIQKND